MKKLLVLFMCIIFQSCLTYQSYVNVENQIIVPENSKSIYVDITINQIKSILKENQIMFKDFENGIETEEILLDEGTRAKYKIYEYNNQLKIVSYWGITQKVKSNIVAYAGASAASAYDVNSWDMVVYNKKILRSKKVFDYMVQIIKIHDIKITFN